ncbi:TraR/DksA C4-type zinc finger protein [Patescibacteria group bacterium]|nr:TraR/DksA C4-type zinc finger protein [Patescibacteria group bacterium]
MSQDSVKEKLEKEKENLIQELDYYKREDPYLAPDRNTSNTLDDDITEIEGHDRITATRINLKERLADVRKALDSIEDGSYGVCKNCGKKIPEERLAAMATALYCIECNQKIKR